MQELYGGTLLCADQVAIMSFLQNPFQKGVSFISLSSNSTKWQVIPDEIIDVGPTVAGDAVAVITHSFHTIQGFSKATGELLWQKETGSRFLESDGKLFYVLTEDERTLHALDPASGNVVWSLRLPYLESGFYSYHVHGGRLYSASVVVDLSRKVIVHRWAEEPAVNALAFGDHGQILTGDEFGVVRIYDHAFRRLRTIRTDRKAVVGLASVGRDVLVSTEANRSGVYRTAFARVTEYGKKKWQLAWRSGNPLGAAPFAVAGRNVVMIEPNGAGDEFWLSSRKLSTGQVNWRTDSGDLVGDPVLCGETVYLSDGQRIHAFDLRSGAETALLR